MSDSGPHRPRDVSQTNAQASCLGAKPDRGPRKVRKKTPENTCLQNSFRYMAPSRRNGHGPCRRRVQLFFDPWPVWGGMAKRSAAMP